MQDEETRRGDQKRKRGGKSAREKGRKQPEGGRPLLKEEKSRQSRAA